jgi:hypothetical protein
MIDANPIGRKLGAYKSAAAKTGLSVQDWMAMRINGQGWCYRCRSWKPQKDFAIDKSRTYGHASICKPCCSTASTACRYGISRDRLQEIRASSCAICKVNPVAVVDHCHKSGNVRDGLCTACNNGIGMFGDNPELLRKALNYLEIHNGRNNRN